MKTFRLGLLPAFLFLAAALASAEEAAPPALVPVPGSAKPLVQIALLLDTSNSMDGLIVQAKAQLWRVVNEFATAKRAGARPILQVALYQYGTPSLGKETGYIRQVLPLTDDLDKVSEELNKLTTNGGDEYCGWVIKDATAQLAWSGRKEDYKAIFIAGNEPFTQGPVDYHESCKQAIAKGILVNTIYCNEGSAAGEVEGWQDGARLADGNFMQIEQNRVVVQVAAPQDKDIARLGLELNKTYIAYGARGQAGRANQDMQEGNAHAAGNAAFSERQYAKASEQYRNANWDLVDALKEKEFDLSKVKDEELPEEMRKLNLDERKALVEKKRQEREDLKKQIQDLGKERLKYVEAELAKQNGKNASTLGDNVRQALRAQAKKNGFQFEE